MWDFRCELIRSNARLISDRIWESETESEWEEGVNEKQCGSGAIVWPNRMDEPIRSTMSIMGIMSKCMAIDIDLLI